MGCILLLWWAASPLVRATLVCLRKSEAVFIARMQYAGLPGALNPPTHRMAVLVQQPTVPRGLVSLRRASVLSRNSGWGVVAEASDAELAEPSTAILRQLFEVHCVRSAALALGGLRLSLAQRHLCLFFFLPSRTLTVSPVPSWTLHMVEDGCLECLQDQGYAEAVKGAVVELSQTSPDAAEGAAPPALSAAAGPGSSVCYLERSAGPHQANAAGDGERDGRRGHFRQTAVVPMRGPLLLIAFLVLQLVIHCIADCTCHAVVSRSDEYPFHGSAIAHCAV
ncbi:hypothetical protein IOCL2690_000633300 [Leishmania lindenbergi]|uniref:Uncharacterized protein n=1 Tax=Leishmania lindenbergi TaxID=651832 RepID=A0AAW3A332_9TRYP